MKTGSDVDFFSEKHRGMSPDPCFSTPTLLAPRSAPAVFSLLSFILTPHHENLTRGLARTLSNGNQLSPVNCLLFTLI